MNRYVQKIRKKIAFYCEELSEFEGEIECDESYFRGKRKGDKGGSNKQRVFGILKREGKVHK